MGLDYGEKTIGVAVSDETCSIAFGLEVIRRSSEAAIKKSIKRLEAIITEYRTGTIVLGYPRSLSGEENRRAVLTREFKERLLRNFKRIDVVLWDERFTTAMGERALREGSAGAAKKAAVIDMLAAVLILQSYLDRLKAGDFREEYHG